MPKAQDDLERRIVEWLEEFAQPPNSPGEITEQFIAAMGYAVAAFTKVSAKPGHEQAALAPLMRMLTAQASLALPRIEVSYGHLQ